MLVLGRYVLVVYSPGKGLKSWPAKVFKMSAIQDGRQNFNYLELSKKHTYLGFHCIQVF